MGGRFLVRPWAHTQEHLMDTRRISLLKPTGHLTLGNYLGALRGMSADQDRATCFFGIADLHALTVPHSPADLRARTGEMQRLLLAVGLRPDSVFVQSHVPAHTELAYLLESTAYVGELSRMIQFKEKGRGRPQTRVSLYTYPALMAADILLYRASEVPAGDDQRQHLELTRDLALRFNAAYGPVFTVPRMVPPRVGARVMDLQDPTSKMGKSTQSTGAVYLLDPPDVVAHKIARAVTDSDIEVRYDPAATPGISNLLEILAACTGAPIDASVATTYGQLKKLVTEAVLGVLEPIQQRYAELDPDRVNAVYAEGAHRCRHETAHVLAAARAAIGL